LPTFASPLSRVLSRFGTLPARVLSALPPLLSRVLLALATLLACFRAGLLFVYDLGLLRARAEGNS
jgi:hypothetical protein